MTGPTLEKQLIEQLNRLPYDGQRRVLEFARALARSTAPGEPGRNLLRWVGCIPPEDLKEMAQAIETDCERIEPSEW